MNNDQLAMLNITNYKISSYFTRSSCNGGGVVILTHKNITCKQLMLPEVQSMLAEKEFECCLSEIVIGRMSIVLVCMYRTPKHCYLEQFFYKFEFCHQLITKFILIKENQ